MIMNEILKLNSEAEELFEKKEIEQLFFFA